MLGNDSRMTAEQERNIVQNATRIFTIDVYYSKEINKMGLPCLSGYDINKIACATIPGLQELIERSIKETTDKFANDFITLLLHPPDNSQPIIDVEPIAIEDKKSKKRNKKNKSSKKKETVPADTVPADTVPAETVPAETVPAETVPAETVPAETVPAETNDTVQE